jgi:hypothetical protein
MASPLESDGDESPPDLPLRGEIIGRVFPRTTLRPAMEQTDDEASDQELAQLLRRTDPRTEGDSPSVERVRTSLVDAVGTAAGIDPPCGGVPPEARARAIIEELHKCGPGDEQAYLEPLRHLGPVGLAALARSFPGLLWFDRTLPHQKAPRGRDASPVCSLLVELGAASAPVVATLLEAASPTARYYAALVAVDLGAPALIAPLTARVFDDAEEVRDVALRGLAELARSREQRHGPADAMSRALDEASARMRIALTSPTCTAYERIHALTAVRGFRDPKSLEVLAPFAGWIDKDVAETAREALSLITAEDLGADSAAWTKWIRKNGKKPRTEWLVAALAGARTEMRVYAHAELVRLLGTDFGYSVRMGPIDRMVAQRRASKLARVRGLLG